MLIRDLFQLKVTRDIPPVVYFHEQTPAKLAAEVDEYIITGGFPADHPGHRRVPSGIHEQYVHLLTSIAQELDKPGGPELPTAWISGFYGSGKSSFAKLLGLALDGAALPDGTPLAEAWLRRDTTPKAPELRAAWQALRAKVDPLAVVFDVGGAARDNEHIHACAIRQVQRRLGYCSSEPLVADFELKLERDGEWERFLQTAERVLKAPWTRVKDRQFAEEDFSLVLSTLYPERYSDPASWILSRGGTHRRAESPEEAVAALGDMLRFRRPGATLFLVVDEVSQYVLANKDRVDRLRAFATALGAALKGQVWLLALGQQKLDEEADAAFLTWAKDRFPPRLRVHLATSNIRDVVHKRLLQKTPAAEAHLRVLFERHRPDLKLFAYGCEAVTPEEFIEVYPMLPGHIDLLLQLTTALRSRSSRAQGDDQAIRGLLQLLGELFRDQKLADQEVGALVTLDQVYNVQHTALDSDTQASMARILEHCSGDESGLQVRVAKAVALLQLIQEKLPTDAKLVAACLYDRLDRGNHVTAITEALEDLRRRNLLGFTEKLGYQIQSSAGEEWERERRDISVSRESLSEATQEALKFLVTEPERPRLSGRPFPFEPFFSDGRGAEDMKLGDPREEATVPVDLRFLPRDDRAEATWVRRSAEEALKNRLLWLAGDSDHLEHLARELRRSQAMTKKYKARRESLNAARKVLLQQEENRAEELEAQVRAAAAACWLAGRMYFRGRPLAPKEQGAAFGTALLAAATRLLPELYPYFITVQLQPSELLELVKEDLSGVSSRLVGDLGILELDAGRYVPTCSGDVPRRLEDFIGREGGVAGATLLATFGAPPYGYTANVVKACVAGLLRAGKLRVQPEGGSEVTAVRDVGVKELFEKDRAFRRATLFPTGDDDVGVPTRARICRFFADRLQHNMDREDHAIADAVAQHFPVLAQRLRGVLAQLARLPGAHKTPEALDRLEKVLEQGVRLCRQTRPTVKHVKQHLQALQDGVALLQLYDAELKPEAVQAVRAACDVRDHLLAQLRATDALPEALGAAAERIQAQLQRERPWQDLRALAPDLEQVRAHYGEERQRLLAWQEEQAEVVRVRLRGRTGMSGLRAEDAHKVLRPVTQAITDTSAEAIAPPLVDLQQPFLLRLHNAEDRANELLDELLSTAKEPAPDYRGSNAGPATEQRAAAPALAIVKVDLGLRNRELRTAADVEALVDEVRKRLLDKINQGVRVRLS